MKQIPQDQLFKESRQTGVSVYLLTRRFLKYRKLTKTEKLFKNCCGFCKASDTPVFDGVKRFQCHVIGIGNDVYADINPCRTCDYYIKSEYKLSLLEGKKNE